MPFDDCLTLVIYGKESNNSWIQWKVENAINGSDAPLISS